MNRNISPVLFVCASLSFTGPIWASNRLLFEANGGQFPKEVQYGARSGAVFTAITGTGIQFRSRHDQISVHFIGARASRCESGSPIVEEANYLSLVPAVTHVPEYSMVLCPKLYSGIDWKIRASGSSLEHDWEIAPGAKTASIVMELQEGALASVTPNGDLLIRSADLTIGWRKPTAWQQEGTRRRAVSVAYKTSGRRITLETGPYNRNLSMTIDPVIDFSNVFTGDGDDRALKVALDAAGNVYVAGVTLSPDFMVTPGAVFTSPQKSALGTSYQVFVRKYSPDGSNLIYSTYLGLATNASIEDSDNPIGMRVDASGNVYVAAVIFSEGLPANASLNVPNGIVGVYKIAAAGNKLIYAARVLPGFDYTEGVGLAIDDAGSVYVAAGDSVVEVTKIDPGGATQLFDYTTTVSSYPEALADIAVGSDGSVYIAGTTASGGLITTPGAMQTTALNLQSAHGYLIRLKPDGSGPIYSTYVAGGSEDGIEALTVDPSGAAYVGGYTFYTTQIVNGVTINTPGIQGSLLGISSPPSNASTAFVVKVSPAGNASGFAALVPGSSVSAIAVDASGNVYTAGQASAGGGSRNSSALPNSTGVALAKVDAAGQNLIYYSTIPTLDVPNQASGNTGVGVIGLAVDPLGAAWVAGASASASVPQTDDIPPIAPNAFLLKIDPTPDQADLQLSIQSSPANFTVGKNVTITFAIQNLGPAAAQDVVFTVAPSSLQGALMASCQATGSGVCSIQNQVPNPSQQAPRVAFDSIVAGASETVTLVLTPTASPYAWVAPPVLITPSVSAATSDISQNNNTATAVVPPDWVSVYIHSYLPGGTSDLGLAFSVGGASPAVNIPGLPSVPILAAPTATIQVSWASPQMTSLGSAVTFRSWSDGDTSNPRQFSVGTGPSFSASAIFEPFSTPYITAAGVTNAGSYAANGVSPGEIIALFGLNFGTATNGVVNNRAFTTTVAGTTIFFDGVAAPLIYVSPAQANAVVPYEVAGQSSTTIAVQSAGGSMSLQVPVLPAVPALFTLSGLGMGQVAALNQDGTINSPLNPANPGDVIVLFGTGEGLLQPVPADGAISSIPAPAPILPITVAINYQQAQVLYAAEAPSLVAGVIQMNVRIPAGIAQNQTVPVTWSAGLYFSPGGTTIAVK